MQCWTTSDLETRNLVAADALQLGSGRAKVVHLGADPATGIHVDAVNACTVTAATVALGNEAMGFKNLEVPRLQGRRAQHDATANSESAVQLRYLLVGSLRPRVEPIHAVHHNCHGERTRHDASNHLLKLICVDAKAIKRAGTRELGVNLLVKVAKVTLGRELACETDIVIRVISTHVSLFSDRVKRVDHVVPDGMGAGVFSLGLRALDEI